MPSFEDILANTIAKDALPHRTLNGGECQSLTGIQCNLCHAKTLTYEDEVMAKQKALQKFWSDTFPSITLEPFVISPRGRRYRSVTKRKVFETKHGVELALLSPHEDGKLKPFDVVRCAIEPEEHAAIYAAVKENISQPTFTGLRQRLNYIIIKGNYKEQYVIFNVTAFSSSLSKTVNSLSKILTRTFPGIKGIFVFNDESSDSRYYMSSKGGENRHELRKIFGKPEIHQKVLGKSFLYSPLSFSQVNPSIVESMITTAANLLPLHDSIFLYDLYCGYGLFSLCLAEKVRNVIGVEIAHASIDSAIANAKRQKVNNVRFFRNDITAQSIQNILRHARRDDVVLLDPPRNGTAAGVIESIALQKTSQVLHISCNIDLIPKEIKQWLDCGYNISKAIPFDNFPGTHEIEFLILLGR